ncbi:DUF7550 family protein [Halobellus rufus]|uniref:DUF7550 family protein n=1 Tax=Halobellus rufus TaxID=1448860 RepID=UPI0012DFF9F6|nr:hypothetical protein [Halobellus rufus]
MSDHDDHGADGHGADEHGHDDHGADGHGADEHGHDDHGSDEHGSDLVSTRVTSPMQDFGMSQVTTGLLVLAVGLVVVFGIPLLV